MVKKLLEIELIGSVIEVIDSRNKYLIGIKGKVIDETRNIIIIEDENNKIKKLIRSQVKIKMVKK